MVHRSRLRRVASWLLITLTLGPEAGLAARTASTSAHSGRPLPDSVLAEIGGRRRVTLSAFRRGWTQVAPPERPDSLTPDGARRFLDLLINKEVLAARATQEPWTWTAQESAQVENLRDRVMMRLALDSAMAVVASARAARGDSALGPEGMGVAARESTVARLAVTYEEVLLARIATRFAAIPRPSADSSLWSRLRVMGEMPKVDRADSTRVIAWSGVGTLRVADLLQSWAKLNPILRPRIETAEDVRDLVKNGLYERVLRRSARERHLERDPFVNEIVRRQTEFNDVQYLVRRDVYQRIPMDSLTLHRFYAETRESWTLAPRMRVIRMVLPRRAEASLMAVRLRDPTEAETLVARGLREHVRYTVDLSARDDSVLFARLLKSGTGTVVGPDSVADGWQVIRVNAVVPAIARSFDDVRELLEQRWANEEGERRLRTLLDQLRKRIPVVINPPALARLVREGVPDAPSPGRSSALR
jgi:hypothetical protein